MAPVQARTRNSSADLPEFYVVSFLNSALSRIFGGRLFTVRSKRNCTVMRAKVFCPLR